jgi:hypothetical protein
VALDPLSPPIREDPTLSIIEAVLGSLSARLTRLGAEEVVSVTASTWSTAAGGHTTTCPRAVPPVDARPLHLHDLAQDPCPCRAHSTLNLFSTSIAAAELGELEACVSRLELTSAWLERISTPATSVAELEERASRLTSSTDASLFPSVDALLQARREDALAGLLKDLTRLERELDQEFAARAVKVPAHFEHVSLLPAAAVFTRVLEEARAALVDSPTRVLVRVNTLSEVLVREGCALEHFLLESTRLHGDVHLLTCAQRAALRCHDHLTARGVVSDEVSVLEDASVLEAAAVLAAGTYTMKLCEALTIARAL